MDKEQRQQLQAPLKDRYRAQPQAARLTLAAESRAGEGVTCSLDTARGKLTTGLHPGRRWRRHGSVLWRYAAGGAVGLCRGDPEGRGHGHWNCGYGMPPCAPRGTWTSAAHSVSPKKAQATNDGLDPLRAAQRDLQAPPQSVRINVRSVQKAQAGVYPGQHGGGWSIPWAMDAAISPIADCRLPIDRRREPVR